MKFEINLVLCALVILTSSALQTKGQSTPTSLVQREGVSTAPPILSLAAENGVLGPTPSPTSQTSSDPDGAPTKPAVTEGYRQTETAGDSDDRSDMAITPRMTTPQPTHAHTVNNVTPSSDNISISLSAAPVTFSSTPPLKSTTASEGVSSTPGGPTPSTGEHLTTPTPSTLDTTPPPHVSTPIQTSHSPSIPTALTPAPTQPPTTGRPQTSAPPHAPVGTPRQEVPSELNVGDEDSKQSHYRSSPLDPLLAGLVSVFIVTTAIISVVLFLKFRQRADHPEFHRLQDLPMDDLMEDTPLSRYQYTY